VEEGEQSFETPQELEHRSATSDEPFPTMQEVVREHVLRALERADHKKKAAAQLLGISRRALYRLLEKHDLGATIERRERTRKPPQQ
jgi:hypothetical protein